MTSYPRGGAVGPASVPPAGQEVAPVSRAGVTSTPMLDAAAARAVGEALDGLRVDLAGAARATPLDSTLDRLLAAVDALLDSVRELHAVAAVLASASAGVEAPPGRGVTHPVYPADNH